MDQKQSKENPQGKTRDKLDDSFEDLPPRKLGVKQDDAVKGGATDRLADKFP
jgi:hypothetical protein